MTVVAPVRVLSHADVEFSVGAELERAAVMIGLSEGRQVQKRHLAARDRDVARESEAAHPVWAGVPGTV